MYRIFIIIVALLAIASLPSHSSAQALYNNGAIFNITSGAAVYIVGDFTNDATATLNNSGALSISGNTINNGSITAPAAGTLTFNGATAQTLSGTQPVAAKDVVVNNSNGVTLTTPLQIDGAMTFTAGLVIATNASYPVVFTANGSVSGTPTDAAHVNGYVQKAGTGAFIYPVGNATKYQPVGINLTANGSGTTARYVAADAGTAPFTTGGTEAAALYNYNHDEYWDISPVSTATGSVTIYFDGYNNNGTGPVSNLRVAHQSGGAWLNEGHAATSGTAASGSVTSNSISTFSPFTLGSISAGSPLRVRLLSFNAMAEGRYNRIDWRTGVEDAGTTFSVERSADGSTFTSIGNAGGKGSNAGYTYYDEQLLSPVAYYRLGMTDAGGARAYSTTVAVRRDAQGGSVVLSPLPARDVLSITNTDNTLNGQPACIVDMQGRAVASFTLQRAQQIDVRDWPAGIYILRLADGAAWRVTRQ